MKTLSTYLNTHLNTYVESLLDDEDTFLDPERDRALVKDFIDRTYHTSGSYSIKKVGDEFIVDVINGAIQVIDTKIESLTNGLFKFGKVYTFACDGCKNLKTLEGAPRIVKANFNCSGCEKLETLEGGPNVIGYNLLCTDCTSLKTMIGAPEEIGFSIYCDDCKNLKSLNGLPKEIPGNLSCPGCDDLKDLNGAPKKIWKNAICTGCKNLRSLDGLEWVGEQIYCKKCPNLKVTQADIERFGNYGGESQIVMK